MVLGDSGGYITHVCMYICMYVCMHVCMYACIYVCTYVWTHVCMFLCSFMYVSIDYVCIYVFMIGYKCLRDYPYLSTISLWCEVLIFLGHSSLEQADVNIDSCIFYTNCTNFSAPEPQTSTESPVTYCPVFLSQMALAWSHLFLAIKYQYHCLCVFKRDVQKPV